MDSVVVEGFIEIDDAPGKRHCAPKLSVASKVQAFVGSARLFVSRFLEKDAASVAHSSDVHEIVLAFFASINLRTRFVSGPMSEACVGVPRHLAVRIDLPGATTDESHLRLGVEHRNQTCEEMRVGVIVGLGDPDVFAASETNAFVPLFESSAGILLVELYGANVRIG